MKWNCTFRRKWIENAWSKCCNINTTSLFTQLWNRRNECIIHAEKCAGSFVLLLLVHMLVFYHYHFSFFNYNIDIFVSIGQYKHRYVLAYFCWRILLGLQIAGHARYLHFGQLLYFFKIAKISTCLGEIYSLLFRMTL